MTHGPDKCEKCEGTGYDFSDGPMNAGGFGPNNATITGRTEPPGPDSTPCKACGGKGYVTKS
jgi:hypothetical protein